VAAVAVSAPCSRAKTYVICTLNKQNCKLYNRIYLAETRLVASVDGRAGYIPSMYLPASRADGIVLADVRGTRVWCPQIGAGEGSLKVVTC
jgi:hypothetical protein